ncbi:unnamed protein product [Ranitomeya imitator]|uniref:Uncharacterized protein n=1 Tax=Ranitomeya imitator TaxID=111125 RepID=A0ABN9L5M6_9NEOB|nr:unnamed protein product [Ranitomeya imitator]
MDANPMEPGVFNYTSEDAERILSGVMGDAAFLKTPSIIEMKKRYENDSRRLITLQLHLTTLGQYYKEQKIPRGLRSNVRPNLFLDNPTFCTRFTMISNKYAMDVMLLNIEFLQGDIKKLQQNITEGEIKIKEIMKIEEWTIFKEKVDKDMYKFRGDLEETKRKKWSRDNGDYETGQVYAWQFDNSKVPWRKRGQLERKDDNDTNDYIPNNCFIPLREYRWKGGRKRRGGKRHNRSQKENRKKQTTTTSTETTEPQETRIELVVNISSKELTDMQVSVLSKGLSFSPCSHTDWFDLQLDLARFFRTIKLKQWFSNKDIIMKNRTCEFDMGILELRNKGSFTPCASPAAIDAFEKVVTMEVEELRNKNEGTYRHPNILKEEFLALQELVHDGDIIIKPADKGGAVVVMDRSMYLTEVSRQLADTEVYQKMDGDPKFKISKEIESCLKEALDIFVIDQELYEYLWVEIPKTPMLYVIPKIHKRLDNPPGRPIISGGSPTRPDNFTTGKIDGSTSLDVPDPRKDGFVDLYRQREQKEETIWVKAKLHLPPSQEQISINIDALKKKCLQELVHSEIHNGHKPDPAKTQSLK